MANRHLLHKSKLEDFKNYLKNNNWVLLPIKSKYEVLRAVNKQYQNVPLIVYTKNDVKEHYSVSDYNAKIVNEFINSHCKRHCEIDYSKLYREYAGSPMYKLAETILKNAHLETYTTESEACASVEKQMFIALADTENQRLVFEHFYNPNSGVLATTDLVTAVCDFANDLMTYIWQEME